MISGGLVVRELVTKIGLKVNDRQIAKFENRLKSVSASMMRLGKTMSIAVTLPILALGGGMIKAASDAEETSSKFATVFRDVGAEADASAKRLEEDFGLSSMGAKQLLSDTGDLLTGFGFTGKSALDLSNKVNELAVDLASFTNFSGGAEGASAALTKALLGERESVKSLGISILEEDVKKEVATQKTQGLTFATERQAKAYATLTIAQRQSQNAIGDYARTNKAFANQLRKLKAKTHNLAVEFGKIMLPAATKLVARMTKLAETFAKLTPKMQKAILIVGGLVAAIGPLLIIGGLLIKSLIVIKGLLTAMSTAGAIAAFKVALIALAVVALVLALEDLASFISGNDSVIGRFIDRLATLPGEVKSLFRAQRDATDLVRQTTARPKQIAPKPFVGGPGAAPLVGGAAVGGGALPSQVTRTMTAEITVNVPPGTDREGMGAMVKESVQEVLDAEMRQTLNTVSGGR